jgi:hypothetical protein
MEAIAVTPQKRKVEVINQAEPKILTATDVKLRMLEAGVCGTDKEICAFEYGTPPPTGRTAPCLSPILLSDCRNSTTTRVKSFHIAGCLPYIKVNSSW